MLEISGWIAPIATAVAAVMTAANLGARVTGWGFAVFTIGAVAWCLEAIISHQPNLLWSNGFLALVDAIGVYRWLGSLAKLEDGADAAATKSLKAERPLFPLLSIEGAGLVDPEGNELGQIAGAMADCRSGNVAYIVLRSGGGVKAAEFRAIAWREILLGEPIETRLSEKQVAALPLIDPADWPGAAPNERI